MRRKAGWAGWGGLVAIGIVAVLSGCGGGGGGSTGGGSSNGNTKQINAVTFADPWPSATPRWRDIANNLYSTGFQSGANAFNYANATLKLSYNPSPGAAYFTGHIRARGLKPNFAYQLKLTGKPIYGSRGFGTTDSYIDVTSHQPNGQPVLHTQVDGNNNPLPINADDWTNQQLGYAGRWWDDTDPPSTNLTDTYYQSNYPAHTVYGYIFMGDFVTDASGDADVDIAASHSYHITWQDSQAGNKQVVFGTFPVSSTQPPYYGYGHAVAAAKIKLWYEYESGRSHTVTLASGTYHCRLLVTEEAFHTSGGAGGGVWQTVLATEGYPDHNSTNDIVFTIQ